MSTEKISMDKDDNIIMTQYIVQQISKFVELHFNKYHNFLFDYVYRDVCNIACETDEIYEHTIDDLLVTLTESEYDMKVLKQHYNRICDMQQRSMEYLGST
jgi:hypothetical protein